MPHTDQCLDGPAKNPFCNNWADGDPSEPSCISCVPGGGNNVPDERPCVFENTGAAQSELPLCSALSPLPSKWVEQQCPQGFELVASPPAAGRVYDNTAIDLSTALFYAGPGIHGQGCPPIGPLSPRFGLKYMLRPVTLLVSPCHPNHCPFDLVDCPNWLCRAYITNEAGCAWRMWCNPIVHGPQGGPTPSDAELLAPRTIDIFPDFSSNQPMLVRFGVRGSLDGCFNYNSQYCFTNLCDDGDPLTPIIFNCIGLDIGGVPTVRQQLTTLDRMLVVMSMGFNQDPSAYPHARASDVQLLNLVLGSVGSYIEQLDSDGTGPAHKRSSNYDSPSLNRWRHLEDFRDRPPGEPDRPIFPVVTVDGSRQEDGQPAVPINCHAVGTDFSFPAALRLGSVHVEMHLDVESDPAPDSGGAAQHQRRRLVGCINVTTSLLIGLTAAAYAIIWPFKFMGRPVADGGTGDEFDLRVEDPANPGLEHPYIRLVAYGPNKARVPREVFWRGLLGDAPYARQKSYDPTCEVTGTSGVTKCCHTLQTINGSTILAEMDDFGETSDTGFLPQYMSGGVTLFVADLNRDSQFVNGGPFGCDCR